MKRGGFGYLDFANRNEVKCYRCKRHKPRAVMAAVSSGGRVRYYKCKDKTTCVRSS
jgi:hypothetical protein